MSTIQNPFKGKSGILAATNKNSNIPHSLKKGFKMNLELSILSEKRILHLLIEWREFQK